MIGPTKEQLQNAAWWDENAPEGAVCMIDGEFTRWDGTGNSFGEVAIGAKVRGPIASMNTRVTIGTSLDIGVSCIARSRR